MVVYSSAPLITLFISLLIPIYQRAFEALYQDLRSANPMTIPSFASPLTKQATIRLSAQEGV